MDIGRVALKRGPLVYCVEEIDNPGGPVNLLALPRGAGLEAVERRDLFDGIVTVVAEGRATATTDWNGALYRNAPPSHEPAKLTAVPYYIWNNRGPNPMTVWLAET
jgi:DUF1680 family protein